MQPVHDTEAVALLDFSRELLFILDEEQRIVFVNRRAVVLIADEHLTRSGAPWCGLCTDSAGAEALTGEKTVFDAALQGRNGKTIPCRWERQAGLNGRILLRGVPLAGEDPFRSYIENCPDAVLVADDRGYYTYANPAACRMTGYSKDELVGAHLRLLAVPERSAVAEESFARLRETGRFSGEGRFLRKDRSLGIWSLEAVRLDTGDYLAVFKDITEWHRAREQLQHNLKEKEVLLQEIHHRVKNNLNVVVSLLNLQRRAAGDSASSAILQKSESRLRAMALVHEEIYRSENFTAIDFSAYAGRLLRAVARLYQPSGCRVELALDLSRLLFPLETAIPAGLALHELAVNAYRYAFTGRTHGVLTVSLQRHGSVVHLRVQDDGPGFSGRDQAGGLGLELVRILARQLNGSASIAGDAGAEILLEFPG